MYSDGPHDLPVIGFVPPPIFLQSEFKIRNFSPNCGKIIIIDNLSGKLVFFESDSSKMFHVITNQK
jgi:hypothetical protein